MQSGAATVEVGVVHMLAPDMQASEWRSSAALNEGIRAADVTKQVGCGEVRA